MRRFGRTTHIHLVGIGGIGMSGIAELLANLGYRVSGSDIRDSAVIKRLTSLGCQVFVGHHEDHVAGADVVVYSSAVYTSNPEIAWARDHNIPVIPRAEMLAEMMRLKYGVAIAGAHGKTTTTSMVASIMNAGNLDPTVVIGGRLDIWGGSNAKLGEGDILLAEADESDGSFLLLSPTIAVVTNIDQEHLDYYGDMEAVRQAFISFVNKVPFYGKAILCLDNEEIHGMIPTLKKSFVTYGFRAQADLRAKDLVKHRDGVRFELMQGAASLGEIEVGMPGEHNVLNALAAIGVGLELELGLDVVKQGLKALGGLSRRFEVRGERAGILFMDDYGHHPAEITATLKTAKEAWPDRRLVVLFQPHRYTRTRSLFDRFVLSFNDADALVVLPVYAAGEPVIEGVDARVLSEKIREHGHKDVVFLGQEEENLSVLLKRLQKGDLVLTLGAGDVYKLGDLLMRSL